MKFLRPIFLVSLCFIMLQGYSYAVFQPYFQLPSQTGQSGKVLGTNGTTPSWVTGGGGGPTLSGSNTWTATNTYSGTQPKLEMSDGSGFPGGSPLDIQFNIYGPTGISSSIGPAAVSGCANGNGGGGKILSVYADYVLFSSVGLPMLLVGQDLGSQYAISMCYPLYNTAGIYSDATGGGAGTVLAYPWHPATAPTCSIGAGGTTCTTSPFTPPNAANVCTANARGTTPPGGVVGETTTSAPGATETATYTSVSAIGGGATVTFNITCD